MKTLMKILFGIILFQGLFSCSREEEKEDKGIATIVKGNVSDNIRNIKLVGYKIKFGISSSGCNNWGCGISTQEVATVITDENGDYSFAFDYKLKEGESYTFELDNQYHGANFHNQNNSSGGIIPGNTNVIDITAWKAIALKLNVTVKNNNNPPLIISNEIGSDNSSFLNVENVYEQNSSKIYNLSTKPNSDIRIVFRYYTGTNPTPVMHQKVFYYHTTFDDVNSLDYTIDCSEF